MTIRDAVLMLALIGAANAPSKVVAQTAEPARQRSSLAAMSSVSVRADPSTLQILTSLSSALDAHTVHIAPVGGGSPVQSISDLLNLKGVDAAVVPADVLPYLRRDARFGNVDTSIAYVAKLDQEEVHILARREIASLADLAGKRVNFDAPDSRASITGSVLFQALRISVQPVWLDAPRAIDQLRRGEIAAIVHVTKSPARLFFDVNWDDGVHFVPVPFTPEVARTYLPARLNPSDYPLLIGGGEAGRGVPVATVAVPVVLAVNNRALEGRRFNQLSRLIDAVAAGLAAPSPNTAAMTASAAAEVPGWRRITPAEVRAAGVARAAAQREAQASTEKGAQAPAGAPSGAASQNKAELAQQFIRYWQQHAFAEKNQSDPAQGRSGTSTQRKSEASPAAAAQEWEALMEEFLRWRAENYPEQSAQTSGEVFEEVLHTLYRP
jgi:uncharacterized protein